MRLRTLDRQFAHGLAAVCSSSEENPSQFKPLCVARTRSCGRSPDRYLGHICSGKQSACNLLLLQPRNKTLQVELQSPPGGRTTRLLGHTVFNCARSHCQARSKKFHAHTFTTGNTTVALHPSVPKLCLKGRTGSSWVAESCREFSPEASSRLAEIARSTRPDLLRRPAGPLQLRNSVSPSVGRHRRCLGPGSGSRLIAPSPEKASFSLQP
jgi:hypothetical protein